MISADTARLVGGGPFFEDFSHGQVFDNAPSLTVTTGHAAVYQSILGDRLALALDSGLCAKVTGSGRPLVHPNLVINIAIGQSTVVTQRVRANLFYRGLEVDAPVFIGDTLTSRCAVVGLKQNRVQEGKPATGLVALRIETFNQHQERVLSMWRCPMLPLRDRNAVTGHADTFDDIPADLDIDALQAGLPGGWKLEPLRRRVGDDALKFADLSLGMVLGVEPRDTITSAPEFARLTLNVAAAHTDADASPYGRRLVYGGHTISMAFAQAVRALPSLVTVAGWRSCDHVAPVFEDDILQSELTVEATHPLEDGGLVDLRAVVQAFRGADAAERASASTVLDWRFLAWLA